MSFQFPKPEPIILPIQGSDDGFPVNHVYCVGRNYAAHAREMGVDDKEPPLFFSKPNWAVVTPEGVGKLEKGDDVVISIPEFVELSFKIS